MQVGGRSGCPLPAGGLRQQTFVSHCSGDGKPADSVLVGVLRGGRELGCPFLVFPGHWPQHGGPTLMNPSHLITSPRPRLLTPSRRGQGFAVASGGGGHPHPTHNRHSAILAVLPVDPELFFSGPLITRKTVSSALGQTYPWIHFTQNHPSLPRALREGSPSPRDAHRAERSRGPLPCLP